MMSAIIYIMSGLGLIAVSAYKAMGNELPSLLVSRPDEDRDRELTRQIVSEVESVAQHGDWLLGRSYSIEGDVVELASDYDISHAAIYDAKNRAVIEATPPRVRRDPIERFVDRNHRVMVVRPHGFNKLDKKIAVRVAEGHIDTPFDWTSVIGLEDPERYYCTELVRVSYGLDLPEGISVPSDLLALGDVVYNGSREP